MKSPAPVDFGARRVALGNIIRRNFINYVTTLSVAGVILLDAAYDSREAAFRRKSRAQEISRNI